MEAWAGEQFTGPTAEATLLANAKALGGMQVLRDVIELIKGEE